MAPIEHPVLFTDGKGEIGKFMRGVCGEHEEVCTGKMCHGRFFEFKSSHLCWVVTWKLRHVTQVLAFNLYPIAFDFLL